MIERVQMINFLSRIHFQFDDALPCAMHLFVYSVCLIGGRRYHLNAFVSTAQALSYILLLPLFCFSPFQDHFLLHL